MALINYLTTIQFEAGASGSIDQHLADLEIKRPLIVTDEGLMAAGLIDTLIAKNPVLSSMPIFSDTPSNPTERAAITAAALYTHEDCDGLLAIGGGSPVDLAKAVALLTTHDGPLSTYAAIEGGVPRITDSVAPLIAVPTTAGTGSEVGRASLITLEDGRKLGFISPYLIPKRAICDPELTLALPAFLTAATGMDAITHCIETYLSPAFNPPAEAIALDGLARGWTAIEAATRDGDIVSRTDMMMAALQGGLTFQKGLGAVHALSHPLGGYEELQLHHGALNAVLLPHVLRFNAPFCADKLEELAAAVGLEDGAELADAVTDLVMRLNLPCTLSAMGVPADIKSKVADAAVLDHSNAFNPKRLNAEEYASIFGAAF